MFFSKDSLEVNKVIKRSISIQASNKLVYNIDVSVNVFGFNNPSASGQDGIDVVLDSIEFRDISLLKFRRSELELPVLAQGVLSLKVEQSKVGVVLILNLSANSWSNSLSQLSYSFVDYTLELFRFVLDKTKQSNSVANSYFLRYNLFRQKGSTSSVFFFRQPSRQLRIGFGLRLLYRGGLIKIACKTVVRRVQVFTYSQSSVESGYQAFRLYFEEKLLLLFVIIVYFFQNVPGTLTGSIKFVVIY